MSTPDSDFEKLLLYLKHTRGFDFTAYKRTTLQRRVQKRMQLVGVLAYPEYIDFLEVHPDEFQSLFNTILINVTAFFRDGEAWEYLTREIVPQVVGNKGDGEPIRVWVAGCASGEEAYTVAMVLARALGTTAFRERVKIYATDLDEEALAQGRLASYSERDVQAVPADLLQEYFEQVDNHFVFDRELRRAVIFGRHDLIQDAPISRVDLLLCRNTLMYFNAEAQERILARFHFALNEGAFLFLGKAETLLTHANTFVPMDLKNRVFSRVARDRTRDRAQMFGVPATDPKPAHDSMARVREAAADAVPIAQFVVDSTHRLIAANEQARTLFGISPRDLGRPFQDLEVSYRPVELRSGIEQALGQRRVVLHKDVTWAVASNDVVVVDVRVAPLFGGGGETLGASITFEDVTHFKRLQEELLNFNQGLETAYEEVQSTNEELQTTNEELETMNEELQSANEELETINDELRRRSNDLNRANLFLESILGSLRDGVVVIDDQFSVLAWNYQSEDLWGLRADEVHGKHLLNLDIGLPVDLLRQPIRACLSQNAPQTLEVRATNRRGRSVRCNVTFTPLLGAVPEPRGVIILIQCEATS
ncbi:MAG: CheR family methyltransferase [Fimbriimonas sp.]